MISNGRCGSPWNAAGGSKSSRKRIGTAEFRNTQFSYSMGLGGVEKFVVTPELQSENSIGPDPLSHGQVWAISPGGHDEAVGLYRIEVNEGPGKRCAHSQSVATRTVSRKCEDCRAEPLCPRCRIGRRSQSARARIHRTAAFVR